MQTREGARGDQRLSVLCVQRNESLLGSERQKANTAESNVKFRDWSSIVEVL